MIQTILVRLANGDIWQSSNEGYTWSQPVPDQKFVVFYMHPQSSDRAYLITAGRTYWYTTDGGRRYYSLDAPLPPNTFGAVIVHFQPKSDYLIWTGNADCDCDARNCHAEAHYTTDFGRSWKRVETCAQLRVGARQGAAG